MEDSSNKCVICGDLFSHVSRNYQRHKAFTPEDNVGLSHQLSVILLLRQILKLSPAHLETLLKEWGNPSCWGITMCLLCNRIFREAEFVHDRILDLHREFDDLCNEIRGQLKVSLNESPGVNSGTNSRRKTGTLAASDKDKNSDKLSLPPKQITNFQVVEDIRQLVGTSTRGTKVNIIVRTRKQLKRNRSSHQNIEPPDLTPEEVTEDESKDKNPDSDYNENASESTNRKKRKLGSVRRHLRRVKYSQNSAPDIAGVDAISSKLVKKENENGDMLADEQGSSDLEADDWEEAPRLLPESGQQGHIEDSSSDLNNSESDKGSTENDSNVSCPLLKDADNANDSGVDKPKTPHSWVRKHQCQKCPRTPYFKSAFTLEAHNKHVHLGIDRPFQCEKCKKSFKLLRHYNQHQRFHQRELSRSKKPTYCAECDIHFKNSSRLTIHLNSTHNPAKSPYIWARTYQCKKCPTARNSYFKSAFTLEAHDKQVHLGIKRPFQCEKCDKDFATLKNYNQHQVFHQKQIKHPKKPKPERYCAECDHHFLTTTSLRIHLASGIHNSTKSFLCELCTKGFYTEASLESHRVLYHHKELGIDPFKCPHCEQALGTKRSLDNHIRSKHTLDTKFKCPHCPSGFMFEGTLKNHINAVHEKAKLYTCPHCPKVFPISWYLTTHLRTHTGDKPYKCRICSKEFSDGPTYNRHVEAHRGIIHKCPIETCRKQYNTRHAFRVHMKTHGKLGKSTLNEIDTQKKQLQDVQDRACTLIANDAQVESAIQHPAAESVPIPLNNDFTNAISDASIQGESQPTSMASTILPLF